MMIKSLKNSISSLKLAKKASLAIIKDSSFSSLISEYLSSERPETLLNTSNISQPPKSVYLNSLKDMLANSHYEARHIQSVALKFQKILSLEVEQYIIERLLNRQPADQSSDFGGAYELFPEYLSCEHCHTHFKIKLAHKKVSVALANTPTICTVWNRKRLIKNFAQIGHFVNNPFDCNSNIRGYFIDPINLMIIYNGNHSTNVALYENDTALDGIDLMAISNWMTEIYFDRKSNTFNHISCHSPLTQQPLFHENIGYLYEIGQFLYQNNLTIS